MSSVPFTTQVPAGKTTSVKKEHIEAIVFSADLMSWNDVEPIADYSHQSCATRRATGSKVNPFLEKPKQQRMVSYENMGELSAKLQDIMNKETERVATRGNNRGSYPTNQRADRRKGDATSNKTTKNCPVEFDEFPERWAPLPDGRTSSSSMQAISVIPEPPDYDSSPASVPTNATGRKKHRQPIRRNDVVRMRHWGRRLRLTPQLLRPPMIQRETSVSE